MGLYRRKDSPLWWIGLRFKGGRLRESTGTSNRKLAERIHAKRTLEVAEGRLSNGSLNRTIDGSTSFNELAERYATWASRQKGITAKRSVIKKLIAVFGKLKLSMLNILVIEGFQSSMQQQGYAPATVNRHIECLKHMFTKANEWELVDDNTLRKVHRVKLLPLSNKRLRFLSREESAALIAACDAHLKSVVIVALNSGMRKGEILGLEWGRHVDLKHGFLLLDVTKNGERREVPINQTMRATLQGLVRHINSPYVFTDRQGRRFKDIKRSFTSACRRAGIKDFRFHDLRHTFASQLVMAGVDITTVSRLLGHKSLTMTLRYAHLAPAHMVKAVALLDAGHDLVTLQKRGLSSNAQTP